jgi:hypothetical protein
MSTLGIGNPENFPGFTPFPTDPFMAPLDIRDGVRRLFARGRPVVTMNISVVTEFGDPLTLVQAGDGQVYRLCDLYSVDWLGCVELGEFFNHNFPFDVSGAPTPVDVRALEGSAP